MPSDERGERRAHADPSRALRAQRCAHRCAQLIEEGRPYPTLILAQRALRTGLAEPRSGEAGLFHLFMAQALRELGLLDASWRAGCDAAWLLGARRSFPAAQGPKPVGGRWSRAGAT